MQTKKATILNIDFHFGLGFLNELCAETGKDLDQLGQDMISKAHASVPLMMLVSANYAKKRRSETDLYTIDYFYDLIDDNGGINGDFWNEFLNSFSLSMNQNVPKSEEVKSSKKKASVLTS
jgi:hypothetical protein